MGFAGLGLPELLLIMVLVLILFGAGKLPQVFGQLGKGIKAFRDAQRTDADALDVTPPRRDEDPVGGTHR